VWKVSVFGGKYLFSNTMTIGFAIVHVLIRHMSNTVFFFQTIGLLTLYSNILARVLTAGPELNPFIIYLLAHTHIYVCVIVY
jgi:hypothetical protein